MTRNFIVLLIIGSAVLLSKAEEVAKASDYGSSNSTDQDVSQSGSVGDAIKLRASESVTSEHDDDTRSTSVRDRIAIKAGGGVSSDQALQVIELNSASATTIMDAATFALALILAVLVLPFAIVYRASSSFRQAIAALSSKQGMSVKAKRESDIEENRSDYRPQMLTGTTKSFHSILSNETMLRLVPHLPFHLTAKNWQLIFATELHGYSLHSAYRRTAAIGPCIVVGMDLNKHVFAAFCSESLKPNGANFFGNGECWVAAISPRFQVFRWSPGNNEQFVLATDSFLAFGGGGNFALWLDAQFDRGTSEPNSTYGNATVLASSEAFKLDSIEIWSFAAPSSARSSLSSKALRSMSSAFGRIVTKTSFAAGT